MKLFLSEMCVNTTSLRGGGMGFPVGGELVTRVRKINGDEHFSSASFPVLMFCTETSRTTHTHTHLSVQLKERTLNLELIT